MSDLLAFLIAAAGFAGLCLSQSRHQQDILRRALPPKTARTLRAIGYVALTIAFVLAVVTHGPAYGTLVWAGLLSPAAASLVMLCMWRISASQARRRRGKRLHD